MYFRLPLASSSPPSRPSSSHHHHHSHQGNSRYPLSSPTTTTATVCTQNSLATRRDSNSSTGEAKSARAILSRVASSPIVPAVTSSKSHPSSPLSTRSEKSYEYERAHESEATEPIQRSSMVGAMERRWSDGYEAARGWTGHNQREGYISFPDYEKYFPSEEETYLRREHSAANTRRGIQT